MASLLKNVAGQNFTFVLVSAATGVASTSTSTSIITPFVTIDAGGQASTAGTFTSKGNGQWNYAPTQAETNGADLGFLITATGSIPINADFHTDPTNWGALNIDAFGNIGVQSNIKKNTAHANFMFVMTDSTNHAPKTGLTVTSFVAIDGGSFVSTTNAPTELANGWYIVNLSAADVNGNNIALRFTATGSDDLNLEFITQP